MDGSALFGMTMLFTTLFPLLIILFVLFLIGRTVRRGGRGIPQQAGFPQFASRFGCGLFLLLPVCGFLGLMVATAGGAIHPPLVTIAAPYVCDGVVQTQSRDYSYKPGQHGVSRNIQCTQADGSTRDITLQTIGAATVYYMIIFLAAGLLLWGLARLLRPRRPDNAHSNSDRATAPHGAGDMARYLAGRLRIDSDIVRHTVSGSGSGSMIEERLRQLQSLRDDGMITDAEYQAKRAEILSSL